MFGPPSKQPLISIGNETFDKFLGGGFLNSSLNLFERRGPSSRILDPVWNKSLAANTLTAKNNLIIVNFNTSTTMSNQQFLDSLPLIRKVKSDLLYKDIKGKSTSAKIKIAWRYSHRSMSPSDIADRVNQADFGLSLVKDQDESELGQLRIINMDGQEPTCQSFLKSIEKCIAELKISSSPITIIIKDLLHPFSPINGDTQQLIKLMYTLRHLARTLTKGAILISYDSDMCNDHHKFKQQIYNLADCVVAFYSYETDENKMTGYKDIDGTIQYIKVPKINSFGFHFQQDLSDWAYRMTRNHRFFVIDELSLPPCDDDEEKKTTMKNAQDLENIHGIAQSLKQVGPLEDFKEVAVDIIPKRL